MAQRTTAEKLDLPLKVLAILTVVGFLYWLSTTAEPTEVVVQEEEEEALDADIAALRESPWVFDDQRLQLSRVTVENRIGLHAFWAARDEVATNEAAEATEAERQAILVRLPRQLVDRGVGVGEGQQVWITGYLHQVTDSVLDAWEGEGVFEEQEQRGLVADEGYFFEADAVHTSPPQTNGDDPQAANQGTGGSP